MGGEGGKGGEVEVRMGEKGGVEGIWVDGGKKAPPYLPNTLRH